MSTDLGPAKAILGMAITRDRSNHTIYLDQQKYTRDILTRYGMEKCNGSQTPYVHNSKLLQVMSPPTPDQLQHDYQSMVGSLIFLAVSTRPDISYAVAQVSRFASKPQKEHFDAIKRILRYLQATSQYRLQLGGSIAKLVGYSDADYANSDFDRRRSISGYAFYLGSGVISWSCKFQSIVAQSTAEAEYVAMSAATNEAVYLKTLLQSIGISTVTSIYLNCDNQAAQAIATNPVHHSRTKHIDVKHHSIRYFVEQGDVKIQHCASKDMIADILTKGLPIQGHKKHTRSLGLSDAVHA